MTIDADMTEALIQRIVESVRSARNALVTHLYDEFRVIAGGS